MMVHMVHRVMFLVCIAILLCGWSSSVVGDPLSDTEVFVDPVTQTVVEGETFDVTIRCAPAQPIKAFELKVSFDPGLLTANSVSEGDIFTGFSTFNSTGVINNSVGEIRDVYNLIVGSGNVSANGSLIVISFTAKAATGTSVVDVFDVGVTNESSYVSVVVSDGWVLVNTSNTAPNTPTVPSGPASLGVGVSGVFSTSGVDPDGDQVQYRFDWGDGRLSSWTALGASGHTGGQSVSWSAAGNYSVRAQCRDVFGVVSSWSEGTAVEVVLSNLPPNVPGSPSPGDDARNVDTSVDIGWVCTDPNNDTLVFDVYFGGSTPPVLVAANTSNNSYDPGKLSSGSTYYWRVVAWDSGGLSTSGPVWSFRTKSASTGGGGGGYIPPETMVNTPPQQPRMPDGPVVLKVGQNYSFSSVSYDLDGDQIRYRFSWGDDSTSAWSALRDSNETVVMRHQWLEAGAYMVSVLAQDAQGENSSWSDSLEVSVSVVQNETGEMRVDAEVPQNISTNQTVQFNGTLSFASVGEIVRYHWDFGDGTSTVGAQPYHVYGVPGTYTVTLTVVDDAGNVAFKSFEVTVSGESMSQALETAGDGILGYWWIIVLGGSAGLLVVVVIRYRVEVQLFLLQHRLAHVTHTSGGPRVWWFGKPQMREKTKHHAKKRQKPSKVDKAKKGYTPRGVHRVGSYDFDLVVRPSDISSGEVDTQPSSGDRVFDPEMYRVVDGLAASDVSYGFDEVLSEVERIIQEREKQPGGYQRISGEVEKKVDALLRSLDT